jgi:transposase
MAWKTMDVQEQRVRFVVAASREEKSMTALCQEFGISRPTGMLWKQRYAQSGLAGIAERSRKPHHSPGRTVGELEQRVAEVRGRYPDWGARKLQVLLAREGVHLTHSTIHRILLRHDLVPASLRRQQALQRFERDAPNELWQMDFKSPKGWNAPVGPLSVLDDHSRYLLVLRATWSTRAELVREQLESAFQDCGVPQAMLMDHGIPWWSTLAPGGMTGLTLWLMKQGIELHWSGRRHRHGARWNAFTENWSEHCTPATRRAKNRRPGWISFAGNTTMCAPTKRWGWIRQRSAGRRVSAATCRIRRAGSIRRARGYEKSTAPASCG